MQVKPVFIVEELSFPWYPDWEAFSSYFLWSRSPISAISVPFLDTYKYDILPLLAQFLTWLTP